MYIGNEKLNLPSFDPLNANGLKIVQETGPVEVEALYVNANITGLSKGKFTKFRGFDKNQIEIAMRLPSVSIIGNYTVKGRALILPITGAGNSVSTLSNDKCEIVYLKIINIFFFSLHRER
jgi:Haemolymph juvenile hormone binding protein (JHBP)